MAIRALLTEIESSGLFLAMDTGATVNVLSDDSFRAIKRKFRGDRSKVLTNLNALELHLCFPQLGKVMLLLC